MQSAFANSPPTVTADRKGRSTFPQEALPDNVLKLRFFLNSFIHTAAPGTSFSLGCCPGTPFTFGGLLEFLPSLAEARDCQSLFEWGVSIVALFQEKDESGADESYSTNILLILDTAQTNFLFKLTDS